MVCEHKRIKKNYPFGRKSTPIMYCEDCGIPLKPYDLMKIRQRIKRFNKKRGKKWNGVKKR